MVYSVVDNKVFVEMEVLVVVTAVAIFVVVAGV